ncbi:MAG: DUF3119 family protein [Thermosynechococcaceae cyanobacterium]
MISVSTPTQIETVILKPSYRLPVGLAIAALPLAYLSVWAYLPLALFAVFLAIQAATLRLHFTATDLEIYRGQTQIRNFPYASWYYWDIYWAKVPILFYFREVNNFHFLPMLFNPSMLTDCLNSRCPRQVKS